MKLKRPLLTLVGVVVLTLLSTLVVLNLRAEKKIDVRPSHLYAVSDPQFVRSMSVLLGPPLIDGNTVETLINGDQIFPSMLKAISGAQQTVDFETYRKPMLKTWFTGGIDDPRITAIGFSPSGGYYWDNKHGDAVAGIKVLVGAAIGKTLDDSVEGVLTF